MWCDTEGYERLSAQSTKTRFWDREKYNGSIYSNKSSYNRLNIIEFTFSIHRIEPKIL